MSTSASSSLTSTLIVALAQTDALQRQLQDNSRVIEALKRENQKLKDQVHDLRQHTSRDDHFAPAIQPDHAAQLETLFKRDVEKQAEIDRLKGLLNDTTSQQTRTPVSSSPLPAQRHNTQNLGHHRPLREIAPNVSPRPVKRQKREELDHRGAHAIPFVAEDGVDHNGESTSVDVSERVDLDHSPNRRLQSLLAAPSRIPTIPARSLSTKKSPFQDRAPKDEEPLRARPVHRLDLSHFKVNPKYNNGLDFAFQEVGRDKKARTCLPCCTKECCAALFRVLAKTLPIYSTTSERELLIDFLGPGSEERIDGLTIMAKANLVHEARTKNLADAYGRMHRADFRAPSSPPEYWSVEMPSTQEQQQSKEEAMCKEREEVARRYHEAMSGGRWIFADEG